ncbi:hypothetical protein NBRC116594_35280 [Shimia sp. NS0008-38b]|uniref:YbaK/EbsC family protein n=1 Tax=Shimia sp. NS0008-38b TaxID=3127653 RepID=UPI0031022699
MRAQTGFAIGGVSPVGHLTPPTCFIDSHLMQFHQLWAAAGTPNHVFCVSPHDLHAVSGAKIADFSV